MLLELNEGYGVVARAGHTTFIEKTLEYKRNIHSINVHGPYPLPIFVKQRNA